MKRTAQVGAVAGVALLALAAGCSQAEVPWPDRSGLRVMTSFPPIYCFAANVAGDDASVLCLMQGTGPHGYEPTARDVLKLHHADLFIINGLELDDDIAGTLRNNAGNPRMKLLKAAGRIPVEQLRKFDARDSNHEKCSCCSHGLYDPHVWLGIPEAVQMVEAIRDELQQLDPAHADGYGRRADAYIGRLRGLLAVGLALLGDKQERKVLTFHDSLHYFARSFGLEVAGAIEFRPGEEPSAGRLARLVQMCRDEQVRLLAVEPQYPTNTAASAILRELHSKGMPDAAFVVVDPIETAPADELTPDFYEQRMRHNLDNLARALR